MYFLVLAASLALAIPTFGGSIAFFLLFRNWWDNGTIKLILQSAEDSLESGEERLYSVNRSAVKKVFSLYGTDEMEVSPLADGRKLYSGTIRHPKHGSELFLGIFRKSITGELEISAKPVEASRVESIVAEIYREMKAKRNQKPAE